MFPYLHCDKARIASGESEVQAVTG